MAKKLIRWFTYTILFALLPIAISLMLRFVFTSSIRQYNYAAELLFFTLMVSATTLGDIKDFNKQIGKDILMTIFFSTLLLLSIVSSILYSCSIICNIIESVKIDLYGNILILSICVSLLSSVLGTIVQILLAKVEVQSDE